MDGLSPAANAIIEPLSSLEILSSYYLIGGTSLSLQIKHRLSEDLDFCQWIPGRYARYAIPANAIHSELEKRFGAVQENHLDFHQVNYLVERPTVKITFYQTDLIKPDFEPRHLLGNILMAPLGVLGGSKMYVITQRCALRDYYDLLILVREGHLTIQQMVEVAGVLSRRATPQRLFNVFNSFSFDGNRFKLSDLDKLEPRYTVTAKEYETFSRQVAIEIQTHYGDKVRIAAAPSSAREPEHLLRKIAHADQFLDNLITNVRRELRLTAEEVELMVSIGPYPTEVEHEDMSAGESHTSALEAQLATRTGLIRNLIYNLKEKGVSDHTLNGLKSESGVSGE